MQITQVCRNQNGCQLVTPFFEIPRKLLIFSGLCDYSKDSIYLYITGETSPLKTWENMIPDIHGEHFRLTDAQWKYLSDAFKIEGVPTYLIVDREGNTTFRQTGFPGVEKMKEELLKVTK